VTKAPWRQQMPVPVKINPQGITWVQPDRSDRKQCA